MKNGLSKRIVSALLSVCILIGLMPMRAFATVSETKTAATRAATDLTATISGLSAPIKQTNAYFDTKTYTDTKTWAGTYYIVNKDADGNYRVMDAPGSIANTKINASSVTISNNAVIGADISMAIDLVFDTTTTNAYYWYTSQGFALVATYDGTNALLQQGDAYQPFGFGTGTALAGPVAYRNLSYDGGWTRYDLMCDGTDGFHWIKNVPGYYPVSHQVLLYKIAQRWDTEQLYNAIQTMKPYAAANNGRYPEALHQAFMECMDASINLYNKYNVATGSESYESIVAIRSELKAQTQWLLSYQNVLQASYAEAIANLTEVYNEYFPVTLKHFTEKQSSSIVGTYYVVSVRPDGTSGKVLDMRNDYASQEYFDAVEVSIANGSVVGAEGNLALSLIVGSQNNWSQLVPTYGLSMTLDGLSADQTYYNLTDGRHDTLTTYHDGKFSFIVHPHDVDGDGNKDRFYLTYKSDVNGFRFWANFANTVTADNVFTLFKVAEHSIALNNAIKRMQSYATDNADGKYPEDVYNAFLNCLNESIELYLQYNVALNTTDAANLANIQNTIDKKVTELLAYRAKLTSADTLTEYIDIPMELYDFRADGLFFEYLYGYYNLGSAPGSPSNHGRLGLTFQNLTNRQIAYKKEVIDYVVNAFYNVDSISKENAATGERVYTKTTLDEAAPGWNDVFYNMLPTVSATPLEKGTYADTIEKTSNKQNGGELRWSQVQTYYDLAYYLLTYLWRPVDSADIVDTENNLPYNTTITERDRLRLYADENGIYTLDAAYDTIQDGYYVYNATPRVPSSNELRSALFTPADGFGFETPETMEKVGGDTDRGTVYSQIYDHEMENTNFHFTLHAYGSFVYYESQNLYFDFVGDDDVYFFINGKMALDIGGAHTALGARIDLNQIAGTLGLIDGEVYDFDMFYAERHTTASNLKFSTNIKIVDTDTLTTMGQYALTYNGASKVDAQTGKGAEIIDNGAVFVDDTTAYSFELTNTREVPVYDISFISPTLGANISKDSLTLYKPDLTNGAVTNITDLTVYYHTVTQDDSDNNIIDEGIPTVKTYSEMQALLTAAINKNTVLAEGSYRVSIGSDDELKALLALGIPHNCQISVYGFKRNTTQNDTPFTNKLTSQCSYTRATSNAGSASGEVFTLSGSASRMLRVSSALPTISVQQVVLDYGKTVEIPVDAIAESISTDSFVSVTGFVGITFNGNHAEVLKNLPTEFGLSKVGYTWRTTIGTFERTENGVQFHLRDFFDEIQTVYLVYGLSGCEVSDPDGTLTTYKYFLVELQLIPATSVYYETDFAQGVFDLNSSPDSMFFDFTNSAEEQIRFSGAPYGGHNFSQEENGYWATRSTRTDTATSSDFVIDNEAGTISIDVAAGRPYNDTSNYGPWFTTTHLYGNYPAVSNGKYHPLNYVPTNAEYIQIRFKVEGCAPARSANPRIVVVYDYMKDGTYPGTVFEGRDYTMTGDYVYTEGVYQTITIPVSENFKNADLVTTFGFRFWDLVSVDNGKVTVDYIYVGPAAGLPAQTDHLYFDFDNKVDGHYDSELYSFTNFDDPAKAGTAWKLYSPVKAISVDNETGTMQLELLTLSENGWPGYYTTTSQLNCDPEDVEIFEMRFKMENLVQGTRGETKMTPYFALGVYETIGEANITLSNEQDVPMAHIADGEWITIRRDLRDCEALQNIDTIASLRLYFGGIESDLTKFSELGKITIDYVYMGSETDAPTPDYLYFDFTGTQSDRLRYENPIYGGFNYDMGNWATSANGSQSAYEIDREAGAVSVKVLNKTSDYGPYFATTNTAGKYPSQNNGAYAPLNYLVPENAILRIRFKVKDSVAVDGTTPDIALLMHYTNGAGESKYTSANSLSKTYTIVDDGYMTLTIPLSGTFKGGEILHSVGIRFRNINGNTNGSITIDYIYVGREEDAPAPDYLYFSFNNTEIDQERYNDPIYGGFNFDLANWATGQTVSTKAFTFNHAEGTVAVTVKAGDTGPYFATSNNTGSYPWSDSPGYAPLNYPVPENAVFKIRFKVNDCTLTAETPNIAVLLHYANSSGVKAYNTSLGKTYTYVENEYVTLTVPMKSLFAGGESLHSVGIRFRNLDGLGTVTIDYIYVGREEDFEKAVSENKQTWQTVTDDTSATDKHQDVDLSKEQTSSNAVAATAAVQSTVETATRSANLRAGISFTAPSSMTLNSKTDKTIMDGVTETSLTLTHNGNPLAVYAATIEADSKTTMKVSYAGYYSAGSTEETREALGGDIAWNTMRTTEHAAAYENATGNTVLFAMNGGFPHNGATRGALIMEGNLIQTEMSTKKDEPFFAVLKDGSYAILDYTDDYSNVEEALGLRQWLVKDGVNFAATYTEADEEDNLIFPTHPRTAMGIKADGSIVCVVVDGRQAGYSTLGLTLKDLADLMISLGCVRAANMDGGGSSTFASRYDETEPLTIRNRPSDSEGERSVITALLMISTENDCQHDYSSNNYAISDDGRHSLICDICRQGVDAYHRYTDGVCVCGKTEEVSPNLYFDFSDQAADRERYNTGTYGYHNFDTPKYRNWWQGYWATRATESSAHYYDGFAVNAQTDTLRVNVADGLGADGTGTNGKPYGDNYNWGPWILTAVAFRENPDSKNADTLPLNYDPSQAEIAQVRFKVTGCTVASATDPRVVIIYDYTKGTTTRRDTAYDMVKTYTYTDGEYVTLTFELNETFKTADSIRSFGFRFWDIYSTLPASDANRGTVTIDYIYVGTREDAPTTDDYFFVDFTNTKADQERYAGHTYGGTNLDLAENWSTITFTKPVVSDGILTVKAPDGFSGYGVLNPGKNRTAKPLNYIPSADDYYQIRFRIDDATSSDLRVKGTGRVVLFYSADPSTSNELNFVYYDFKVANEIIDKGWVTLTFKLSDMIYNKDGVKYENMDVINAFTPCFNWIVSAEGKTATYQIDYLYVGPEEKLPTFNRPVYGYDSSYTDDSKLSNGSSLFIEGDGIPNYSKDSQPIYEAGKEQTMVSFTFTGTGFDIISRTGANQGLIRVSVYDQNGAHVKTTQVLNKSEFGTELYQIPVISIELSKHSTYQVKIFVAAAFDYGKEGKTDEFGGALDRGGEFYFDAIRIYNPIDTSAATADAATAYEIYQRHGEADPNFKEVRSILIHAGNFTAGGSMEGVVYLDASSDSEKTALANYTEVGPNNEVYLASGKAIAFKLEVTGTIPSSVDIGAKSVAANGTSMLVHISANAPNAKPTGDAITVTSSTAQYYPINILPSEWETASGVSYVYVTIYNNGSSGILSLTDVKYAYDIPTMQTDVTQEKSIRFIVDAEMLTGMNVCTEHSYSYTNNADYHTAICSVCDYSFTQMHSYTDGVCICGAPESTEPKYELDEDLSFNMSISVGAEMQVVYTITNSKVKDFESFYLEVVKEVAGAESVTTVYSLDEDNLTAFYHSENGNLLRYQAFYTGIFASEMGDDFTATLYATAEDGTIYYSQSVTSSIQSYLSELLARESTPAALKTLAVDMLNYGAAAQIYFGYDTENLVNADLTDEQKALGTQTVPDALDASAVSGDGCNARASVSLQSKVKLYLTFIYKAAEDSDLKVVIRDSEGKVLGELAPSEINASNCKAVYDNVGARQMRELLTIELYDNDVPVSKTLTWSVESYVASIRADETSSAALVAAANAMLVYGDSAAAYFESTGQ